DIKPAASPPVTPSQDIAPPATVCGPARRAWTGQAVPGGGTLNPAAFAAPATIDETGRIAFRAWIDGNPRNQGIFVADSKGVRAIVRGCGGASGSCDPGTSCRDPSPIGGTFSGLFADTALAPVLNDRGDVLFLAEVDGGRARLGLFLYRSDTRDLETIAAPGDPSPMAGRFEK